MTDRSQRAPYLGAIITLVLAILVLIPNIGAHFAEDDEGAYLYMAWRLASGDSLYEDLPTSKPPLTFILGSWVVRLFGPDVLTLRLVSVLAFAATAALLYVGAHRLDFFRHAWLAPLLLVLHPDAYMQGRFFRPDVFALLFSTAGLLLALEIARAPRSSSRESLRLVLLTGLAFGLAVLFKFNATITLGLAAFVLASSRNWKQVALVVAIPIGLGLLVALWFELTTESSLFDLTLGHHARQVADIHQSERVKEYLRANIEPVLICFATFLRRPSSQDAKDRVLRVLALASAASLLVFLFVGREIYMRHFLYLAPCVAILAPPAIESAGARLREWISAPRISPRVLETSLILLLLVGLAVTWEWPVQRAWTAQRAGIADLAEGVRKGTTQETRVLSDYAVVNFLAGREGANMTPQLSQGSIRAGQIDVERVLREIDEYGVGLVIIHNEGVFDYRYGVQDKVLSPSHLVSLPGYADLLEGLDARADTKMALSCSTLGFQLWVLEEDVQLPHSWGTDCTARVLGSAEPVEQGPPARLDSPR